MLKGVQTCSYNDSGENLEAAVLHQVQGERKAGNEFVNHLMLRNRSYAMDQMKFNLLLAGIPLFLYNLLSMHKAGIEEAVTIGNNDTGVIHQKLKEAFSLPGYRFVHEGEPEEWLLSSTLKKASQELNGGSSALVLPGDTPFVSIRNLTECGYEHDLVLPINTREIGGEHFPRNFHIIVEYKPGEKYYAKEPNVYKMNIEKIAGNRFGFEFFDMLFGSRKSYSAGNPHKELFMDLLFRDNGKFNWRRALVSISIIRLGNLAFQFGRAYLRGVHQTPETDDNRISIKGQTISKLIKHGLDISGFRVKIYPTPDPAGLIDLDSLEDVAFAEHLLSLGPEQVYPHYSELKDFARSVKTWTGGFSDNWHKFANAKYAHYGIPAQYSPEGRMRQTIFTEDRILREFELLKRYRQSASF